MHKRTELPRSLPPDGFTVAQARLAGVTPKRLSANDLDAPFHGVRVAAGTPHEVSDRARAYAAVMPAGHYFSHVTAAQLLGMPLPRYATRDLRLHVSAVVPERAPQGAGIAGHTVISRPEVWIVGGLTVQNPMTTWCELAPLVGLDDLIAVGDHLLGVLDPPYTAEELAAVVAGRAGQRGIRRLRQALEWVRPRVESRQETRLRLLLVRAGLPEPETNVYLPLRYQRRRVRGDLVYLRYRTLVEYDGEQHRTDDAQFARDVDRLDGVMAEDWRVIRVLKDTPDADVIARVDQALRSRGWRPHSRSE
ncbi:hypothetical protein BJQ94_03440 [Cryobacterium sp. SO2]|uniref:hypothetical protein n=1 Tax=Cryobacterium sp. SO2 TaxID=1897060 RepID=UPI00223CABAB|nr:hypothetical protein [Cryobacterium sp. SO2]WEO78105.1 hypothetical protein BJQ94_03440 [Cryobacterium sp. SO2]